MYRWNSISELLTEMNKQKCLILRNYECFPRNIVEEEEDIDILCEDIKEFTDGIHAYPVNQCAIYNYFVWLEEKMVYLDIRCIGDGYYDADWEKSMLSNRVLFHNSFYVLSETDYKYSLLYHALIQKPDLNEKYKKVLSDMFMNEISNQCSINEWIFILNDFMCKNKYKYTKPMDSGVYINGKRFRMVAFKLKMKSIGYHYFRRAELL